LQTSRIANIYFRLWTSNCVTLVIGNLLAYSLYY